MMKQRRGLDRNVLRPTPGDPWGVEQHHWNTRAKENQQLNPSVEQHHWGVEQHLWNTKAKENQQLNPLFIAREHFHYQIIYSLWTDGRFYQ